SSHAIIGQSLADVFCCGRGPPICSGHSRRDPLQGPEPTGAVAGVAAKFLSRRRIWNDWRAWPPSPARITSHRGASSLAFSCAEDKTAMAERQYHRFLCVLLLKAIA